MEILLDRTFLKYYNQDLFANIALRTLFDITQQEPTSFAKLFETKEILKSQQPHNIVLQNATTHFLLGVSPKQTKEQARERYYLTIKAIKEANKNVGQIGSKRIKAGSNVFIGSFNNHLVSILMRAAKHKRFKVYVIKDEKDKVYSALIKKLNKNKVEVVEIEWHSLNKVLANTDICLLGGEILTRKKGVFVNKGGRMIAEISQKNNVPVYVCLHTWKYDHKNTAKADLTNQHEYLSKDIITSYICEHGIFKPDFIIQEARFHNKMLFT